MSIKKTARPRMLSFANPPMPQEKSIAYAIGLGWWGRMSMFEKQEWIQKNAVYDTDVGREIYTVIRDAKRGV